MKYASVIYVKYLRVSNFILKGELRPSATETLLIPDSTAPCPGYRTDTQKYIRPGREREREREETRGIREGTQGTRGIDLFWEQLIGSTTKKKIQ